MTGITISVHDLQGRRIAEDAKDPVLGTLTLLREYVWMDGWEPFAVIEGGQVYFLAWNTVGRPEVAFDETGQVVWRARYAPFGGIEAVIVDTALTSQDLRFPGQWFQLETGLHQNWHRDYDPNTGRYLQADPLGMIDGPNVYGYALQRPSRFYDPTGEFIPFLIPALLGAGGNLALQIGSQMLINDKSFSQALDCVVIRNVLISGVVAGFAGGTPIAFLLKGNSKRAAQTLGMTVLLNSIQDLGREPKCGCELPGIGDVLSSGLL